MNPRARGSADRGGEREYFLKLLMREEALKESTTVNSKAGQPAKKEETWKAKVASIKGKKKSKGKTPKGGDRATVQPEKKENSARRKRGVWEASQASSRG